MYCFRTTFVSPSDSSAPGKIQNVQMAATPLYESTRFSKNATLDKSRYHLCAVVLTSNITMRSHALEITLIPRTGRLPKAFQSRSNSQLACPDLQTVQFHGKMSFECRRDTIKRYNASQAPVIYLN